MPTLDRATSLQPTLSKQEESMTTKPLTLSGLALLATFALLLVTGHAGADEVTRDSYRAAVEPICHKNVKANERIFAGVRKEVKAGRLKPAAARFARAAAALRAAITELRKVPRPTADRARLSEWLGKAGELASEFGLVAKELRAGEKGKAAHQVVHLTTTANVANSLVLQFEFHYCRLEPARFT
jgi:hypothetical protein